MTRENEFLTLLDAHKGILHKISKMYMESPEDQQDLFQEIIYQLWKSYHSFSHQSKFSTWMYRVAVNTAITFFKKEKRKPPTTSAFPENVMSEESEASSKELKLSHFYKAVQQLEKIEKALIFYHLENYTHRDISLQLGISEVNARVKLNRAKNKLKELIKNQGYEF
ncbi:RNA polymerase sigma factor [Chitinophaga silvisoli]|uniref:RNA polymerase sigma factor n=1 Tax=Chitinophaga silvisoli TaxID=2291814 RepID=A0A3E1NV49_9BACT|nr:RNA polymerase sigma factor [Chitinophaga silvisoli]RFM31724.1 RNA polymerase sigma factor [Chitinophaga silvisoli]